MKNYDNIYAGERVCCTCAHYYQHYRKGKKGYFEVNCGHCVFPRLKGRRPDQSCEHWEEKPHTDEESK